MEYGSHKLLDKQKKEWILVISLKYRIDFPCQLNVLFYYPLHSFQNFLRKVKQDYLSLETRVIRPLVTLVKSKDSAFISYMSLVTVSF